MNCKNCKYWARKISTGPVVGYCDKIWIGPEGKEDNTINIDVDVLDDSGLNVTVITGAEFGCTLFTAKQ